MAEGSGEPHIDVLFEALSDSRRRQIFAYMHTAEENSFHLDDLVQILASQQQELSTAANKQRERLKLSLHHNHLPKLDDSGIVEYDQRNHDIRYRGQTDGEIIDIASLLHSTRETNHTVDQLK